MSSKKKIAKKGLHPQCLRRAHCSKIEFVPHFRHILQKRGMVGCSLCLVDPSQGEVVPGPDPSRESRKGCKASTDEVSADHAIVLPYPGCYGVRALSPMVPNTEILVQCWTV
uniref:Uncharacterized protein n=1 Tax=Brassica oleracea TaxID=3712 RepID=A0A3P6DWG0_BRAOL|nr:unnamed protein product [Brassica oleracea]